MRISVIEGDNGYIPVHETTKYVVKLNGRIATGAGDFLVQWADEETGEIGCQLRRGGDPNEPFVLRGFVEIAAKDPSPADELRAEIRRGARAPGEPFRLDPA